MHEAASFWNELAVDYGAIRKALESNRLGRAGALYNKIKKFEDQWRIVFRNVLSMMNDNVKEAIQVLAWQRPQDLLNIEASVALVNKIRERRALGDAFKQTCGEWTGLFDSFDNISAEVMAFCLYQKKPEVLRDYYYNVRINYKSGRKYRASEQVEAELDLSNVDIEKIIQEWAAKNKQRSKVYLWWSKCEKKQLRMAFRKQKKTSSVVPLLEENEFVHTASETFFVFDEGMSELNIMPGTNITKEKLSLAEYIAGKILGKKIEYREILTQFDIETFGSILGRILRGENGLVLIEVRVRNAPLDGAPKLTLASSTDLSIEESIKSLDSKGVPILGRSQDIESMVIKQGDKKYRINLLHYKGLLELTFDKRYHKPEDVDYVRGLLERVAGQ